MSADKITPEQLRKEAVAVERMHGETLTVDWRTKQANQLRAHADALEENARLKEELAKLREENTRLRGALAYVVKNPQEQKRFHNSARWEYAVAHGWLCGSVQEVDNAMSVVRAEGVFTSKPDERAESELAKLREHAEAAINHMKAGVIVDGADQGEPSYRDEWSADADRLIGAYRNDFPEEK